MKKFLLLVVIVLSAHFLSAQSVPVEAKVKFLDKEKRAASFEVPYVSETVEKAIEDRMARNGSRAEKVRGYTLYRGAKLRDTATERVDVYVKVERKSRKDKNSSLIYLFALNPNDNAQTAESNDELVDASKEFLGALGPDIQAKDLDNNMAAQTAEINNAEKKLKRLQDDYSDLEKKLKSTNEKMEENRKNQDRQSAEIEKLKSFLDALRDKKRV